MLGHELRNPLSPIVTALALLKMHGASWTGEHAVIERQVHHMSRLVNDLLDVSRITRGTLELRRETLDVANVITRATEMAAPRLEERRHTLAVQVPAGLSVVGDEERLVQVFGNLLSNAATYTPEAGTVSVTAERRGPEVVVDVSDTGRGIPAEIAPRIFEVFVQGPRTIDRRGGRTGARPCHRTEPRGQHDGRIEARSDGPGRGSTFTVYLPACTPAEFQADQARSAGAAGAHARGCACSIVDDNRDAVDMLSMFMTGTGMKWSPPATARRRWRPSDFKPEIAVLDIGLPVMDGYELAGRIREATGPGGPVLVAVTGYGQAEDVERSRAAGFAHHFVKPVDGDDLLRLFSQIAERAPDQQQTPGNLACIGLHQLVGSQATAGLDAPHRK